MKYLFNKTIIIIFAEIVILAMILTAFLVEKSKGQDGMNTGIKATDFHSDYIEYDDGWYICSDDVEIGDQGFIDMLYGPFVYLSKGQYTLVVGYECEHSQRLKPYASGSNIAYIVSNSINLNSNLNSISYNFRIKEDIDNFEIRVFYDGNGFFRINEISLYRNLNTYKEVLFVILTLFIILDLCLINKKRLKANKRELLILATITFFSCLPLFSHGIGYPVEDIDFHLMRIEGLSEELRLGHVPSRIQSLWSSNSGYPVSVYYGDILLYFPAILRILGFSVSFSYNAYIAFINVITVIISYLSFKTIVKDKNISLLMTFAYVTTSYRNITVHTGGLLGEYTAYTFLPLAATAIYMIYTDKKDGNRMIITNAILLALAVSGIILSHTLSVEMIVAAIVLISLLNFRQTFHAEVLITYCLSAIITALLSLFFLIPFLDYYMNVDVLINNVDDSIPQIQGSGSHIYQLFAFFQNPYLVGNSSRIPGMLLMLGFAFGILIWINGRADHSIKILTIFSAISLWISTDAFPWDWFAYNFRIGTILAKVQFSTRYEAYACVSLTVLSGLLLKKIKETHYLGNVFGFNRLLLLLSVMPLISAFVFYGYFTENANVYYIIEGSEIDGTTLSGAEYMRVDQNGEPISYIRKDSEGINAEVKTLSRTGWTMDLWIKTGNTPGIVKTPYTNYKGYIAFDKKGHEYEIMDDEYCKVAFSVPANFDGEIRVTFKEPWYWRLSELISFVAWVGLIVFMGCYMRKDEYKETL